MEIIRIPAHYRNQIEYMSDSDRSYILLSLMRLSDGEIIDLESSMRGGMTMSIWTEACQLEKKARKGKGEDYNEVSPIIKHDIPLRGTPEGDPMVDPKIHPNPTQPKSNQIKSNQIKTTQPSVAVVVVGETDTFIEEKPHLQQKLIEFQKFRQSIKKPIKQESVQAFIRKLEKLSEGDEKIAIQILDESIANGWQGIFPLNQITQKEEVKPIRGCYV